MKPRTVLSPYLGDKLFSIHEYVLLAWFAFAAAKRGIALL